MLEQFPYTMRSGIAGCAQDRAFTNFRGDESSDKSRSFTSVLIRPET